MCSIKCDLIPNELFINDKLETPPLAIVGTCIAEHLLKEAQKYNESSAHYLGETWLHTPLPEFDWDSYRGVVIHLTLRHILDMAGGMGYGDVAYIKSERSDILDLTNKAIDICKNRINEICSARKSNIPLFFLSFLEAPQTTRGIFSNNRSYGIYRLIRDLNDAMSDHLEQISGAFYLEINDIARYFGDGEGSDSYRRNHFTHAGSFESEQSNHLYSATVLRIYHALHTIESKNPIKLIITDLDNTLWNGVAAEEDEIIPWRHHEGWPIGYVEALLECKRRGILLAIASKNEQDKTLENFHNIWKPKISIDDFCSYKINWRPKSENIADILSETNLLPENCLFIDDNPLEINEVLSAFPEIRTLTYPAENWRNVLLHSPQTQSFSITNESNSKTELIKAKIKRDQSHSSTISREEYLASLGLVVNVDLISSAEHKDFPRCMELLNKTNQFNTTGKRWSDMELQQFLADRGKFLSVRARDKFGEHGIIGLMLIRRGCIEQTVLSCRVFGLGIETSLISVVLSDIRGFEVRIDRAILQETGKNAACLDFYQKNGFVKIEPALWIWSGNYPNMPDWIDLRRDFDE
jgi:FkbH-like protein